MSAYLLVIPALIAATGSILYISNNYMSLSTVIANKGFHQKNRSANEAKNFVELLLSPYSIESVFQATESDEWDRDSWFMSVDPGGEDPKIHLLTWKQDVKNIPNFVIGRCIGIRKINKVISLMATDSYKNISVNILPQRHQPFLSARKGLLLYSSEDTPLTDQLSMQLFEQLNDPKLNISLANYNGRLCCWTQGFSNYNLFFSTCAYIKILLK